MTELCFEIPDDRFEIPHDGMDLPGIVIKGTMKFGRYTGRARFARHPDGERFIFQAEWEDASSGALEWESKGDYRQTSPSTLERVM